MIKRHSVSAEEVKFKSRIKTVYWIKGTDDWSYRLLPERSQDFFNRTTFGFEGRIWDLIVSVPDHCLSFYFSEGSLFQRTMDAG